MRGRRLAAENGAQHARGPEDETTSVHGTQRAIQCGQQPLPIGGGLPQPLITILLQFLHLHSFILVRTISRVEDIVLRPTYIERAVSGPRLKTTLAPNFH
jgi:hypothetical protein